MGTLLEVRNLHIRIDEKEILHGLDLDINPGEVHVVMGPNGAGKSTLTNAIMAHPKYELTEGTIRFLGEEIQELPADERAKKGIFLSFQTPEEVPGITLENFLRAAVMECTGEKKGILPFRKELLKEMEELHMDGEYAKRYLNVGFSGGEKKKAEILQMRMLNPRLAMLDETDSGLDVDAVRIVSEGVRNFLAPDKSVLIITHHSEILQGIRADRVHVLMDGRIVKEGDHSLIDRINQEGYEWIREEVAQNG